MDMNMKNVNKVWLNSLTFLDNSVVSSIIVTILVLYCTQIFDNINSFIGNIYNFSFVRFIVLLLIVYVSPKCPMIGILLGISYLISINYMVNTENFVDETSYNTQATEMPSVPTPAPGAYMQNTGKQQPNAPPMVPPNAPPMANMDSNVESFKSEEKEHFFPLTNENDNSNSFNMRLQNTNMNTRMDKVSERKMNEKNSCMQNYVPEFETVSDVCSPTATFKNELNAQGLNFPEGFNSPVSGSPL